MIYIDTMSTIFLCRQSKKCRSLKVINRHTTVPGVPNGNDFFRKKVNEDSNYEMKRGLLDIALVICHV